MEHNRTVDSPATVGLRGRCPRCGEGHLFKGFLSFRPACEVCGLDFRFIDSADGPAFFVMSIVGIVVVALAMWVEFAYEPPMWVHALLWAPLSIVLS
ncbi:membrane protein, partial [Methylobacterium tarhaniae]